MGILFPGRKYSLTRTVAADLLQADAKRMVEVTMNNDLDHMSREALIAEVKKLRAGIRKHRDSKGQALCWHHPELWGLLPEKTDPLPAVPEWPKFMEGCVQYRRSLDRQAPHAPRTDESYLSKD